MATSSEDEVNVQDTGQPLQQEEAESAAPPLTGTAEDATEV